MAALKEKNMTKHWISKIRPILFGIVSFCFGSCLLSCKRAAEVVPASTSIKDTWADTREHRHPHHFLEKSTLLADLNLEIVPVDQFDDQTIRIDRVLMDKKPYLIAADGNLYALHVDTVATKSDPQFAKIETDVQFVLRTDDPSRVLADFMDSTDATKTEGRFVIIGDAGKSFIKWERAQTITTNPRPACIAYKTPCTLQSVDFSQEPAISGKTYVANWKCGSNETIHETIGIIGAESNCSVLKELDIDLGGTYALSVRELVGALTIRSGSESEKWLVFIADGFEDNKAYYALLYQSTTRSPTGSDQMYFWGSY
jgi:hypothetical protein